MSLQQRPIKRVRLRQLSAASLHECHEESLFGTSDKRIAVGENSFGGRHKNGVDMVSYLSGASHRWRRIITA